jgi:hypothetical protein
MTIVFAALFPQLARGQNERGVAVEAATGTAWSIPLPLDIQQQGFNELRETAHYSTHPFSDGAPYYAWRLGWWRDGSAWELQLVHHKIYLDNPVPEVQLFQITHGYTMLTLGRAWHRGRDLIRVGGGVVLARPEWTIRGRSGPEPGDGLSLGFIGLLHDGYFLTGPSARASISRRFGSPLFFAPELELTAARAVIPIAGGDASAPNIAVHLRVAIGFQF